MIRSGEFLTRSTIVLAMAAAAWAAGWRLRSRRRARPADGPRWMWTLGCGLFLAHMVCAFHFFHHWRHADAYRETARQTAALTGFTWGGGLYFNYLFGAAWVADVTWWWAARENFERRPRWVSGAWHAFFFFMSFNGAVVFASGAVRWFGALVCAVLLGMWMNASRRVGAPQDFP